MIRISEIFHSVQGEGKLTGTPSVFLRTSGCNLRCGFCDTPYASWEPEGDSHSISKLREQILRYDCSHLVITGGEPAIFAELGELVSEMKERGIHITIETAGTVYRDWECELWSISPKMSNSTPVGLISDTWIQQHEERRKSTAIVRELIQLADYQLKFVIGDLNDTEEVLDYLAGFSEWEPSSVMMMPKGTTVEELETISTWLPHWCSTHGFQFSDRRHIYWYGNTRGT